MRGSGGRWAARAAATAVAGAVVLLAGPAHAAPDKPRPRPHSARAHHAGIPLNLPLGALHLRLHLPPNLPILGGATVPPTSTPPTRTPPTRTPPTSTPAPSTPPTGPVRPPSHPSPPGPTHPSPQAGHGPSRTHPASRPAASFVATHRAARHGQHRHHHPVEHRRPASHTARHRVAAELFRSTPLRGANVALLLAVIAVFSLGVLGIVLAGGRRSRPASKHRR